VSLDKAAAKAFRKEEKLKLVLGVTRLNEKYGQFKGKL
jgi:hypothetical protein